MTSLSAHPARGGVSGRLLVAVAAGGAAGALLRWASGELVPDQGGFAWTTFGINLVGAAVLALLPALAAVRRNRALAVGLGPGLLGGFTTLSAWSEHTRHLLGSGRPVTAAAYAVGTVVACVAVVALVDRWVGAGERAEFAAEGGDE